MRPFSAPSKAIASRLVWTRSMWTRAPAISLRQWFECACPGAQGMSSTTLVVSCRFQSKQAPPVAEEEEEFSFDATKSIHREAAKANAQSNLEAILQTWLPPNAPDAARNKAINYLLEHPVDSLIESSEVQITHIEENGKVERVSNLSPIPLKDAIETAHERGLFVVQMGEREGKSYVHLRNEKQRVLDLVAADLATMEDVESSSSSQTQDQRVKKCIDHIFRDVVDAHFIGWKSKKIAEDLKKLHPVKIGVNQFQNADSAVSKVREMCNAVKEHAEKIGAFHHFTSINTSDREVSILLTPAVQGKVNSAKTVKHPGEKEWAHTHNRLNESLKKAGRMGTYTKQDVLKPRSLGALPYRVDKFGRRIA